MLTLKILSGENRPDCEPDKAYRIIGGIKEIRFSRARPTDYECDLLGLSLDTPEGKVWSVCYAECTSPDTPVSSHYLLTGNCYILNDEGQTVDTYWPRNKLVDVT